MGTVIGTENGTTLMTGSDEGLEADLGTDTTKNPVTKGDRGLATEIIIAADTAGTMTTTTS